MGLDRETVRNLARKGALNGAQKGNGHGVWLIPVKAVTAWISANRGISASGSDEGPQTTEGDRFQVGDIYSSSVAIGRSAQVTVTQGISSDSLAKIFEEVYRRIEARPDEVKVDKQLITTTVQNVEKEVAKGEEAKPDRLELWLKYLAALAPDILEVLLSALVSPAAGIATGVLKVIRRMGQEMNLPGATP
jgi:hypothetical protein